MRVWNGMEINQATSAYANLLGRETLTGALVENSLEQNSVKALRECH